ncbi:MAG: glycosyltransferase family 9 protein [Bacteroidota bacterium]
MKKINFNKKININDPSKIVCAFHTLNIGDSVVFSASIKNLINIYGKNLYIVCAKNGYNVLKGLLPEENYFIYNPKNILDYIKLIFKLRKKSFDVIFDFHNSFFGIKVYFLPILISLRKTFRLGYITEYYKGFMLHSQKKWIPVEKHEVDAYLDLLVYNGLPIKNKKLYVYLDKAFEKDFCEKSERLKIILHPCCANKCKLWAKERFAEIAQWFVKEYKAEVYFTGMKQEQDIVKEIFECITDKTDIYDFCGKFGFHEFAVFLNKVDLLVSIDTSVVHLASATLTNTVAIFGPTSDIVWRPYNKENQILLHSNRPCYPCDVGFIRKGCNDFKCLKDITVEQVKEAVLILLKNN